VFASSAVFPAGSITYLHPRISQTYITTNQWGTELSSNAIWDISNGYRYREREQIIFIYNIKEDQKRGGLILVVITTVSISP
jgi:hypothetical protein